MSPLRGSDFVCRLFEGIRQHPLSATKRDIHIAEQVASLGWRQQTNGPDMSQSAH